MVSLSSGNLSNLVLCRGCSSLFCHFITVSLCSCVCSLKNQCIDLSGLESSSSAWEKLPGFLLGFPMIYVLKQCNKNPTFLLTTCPSKQSDSAGRFLKYKPLHLPVSLVMYLTGHFTKLEHHFQLNSETESIIGSIITSTCQQIQTSTKNHKHKRRSIRSSNGVVNLLQWKAVEILTYCCRLKAQA